MTRHKTEIFIIRRPFFDLATLKQSQCIDPLDKIYPLLDLAINYDASAVPGTYISMNS